ncbi:hypothetical protein Taro_009656 [Colocasia esculenta]|uniref:Reverse transcriptase n=1 Tax=Colocasia esculenta TaxID=4460 RepID=A0A843U0T1_COLES|nr:hypothetical protein [Colocasia esculenta]
MWTSHDRFLADAKQGWLAAPHTSYPLLTMAMKLKHMKTFFRQWNKNIFKNVTNNVLTAEDEFQIAQSNFDADASQGNSDQLQVARQALLRSHAQEEIFWRQKSRLKWLKEGDGNTKFFHGYANSRRRKSIISQINNDEGDPVDNKDDIASLFVAHFSKAFTSEDHTRHVQRLMVFLRAYEEASGQMINVAKSSFILHEKASSSISRSIGHITGFPRGALPFKYLGVSCVDTRSSSVDTRGLPRTPFGLIWDSVSTLDQVVSTLEAFPENI